MTDRERRLQERLGTMKAALERVHSGAHPQSLIRAQLADILQYDDALAEVFVEEPEAPTGANLVLVMEGRGRTVRIEDLTPGEWTIFINPRTGAVGDIHREGHEVTYELTATVTTQSLSQ